MERKTMIIIAIVIGVILYWTIAVGVSLSENADYKKAKELNAKAEEAYGRGDYDKAYEYAEKAREHTAKADAYVATLVTKNKATALIYQATKRVEAAKAKGAEASSPRVYKQAVSDLDSANVTFKNDQYDKSIDYSNKVIEGLAGIVPKNALPKYYKVRFIPKRRDCFWRIAEYRFIYNNPWKWTTIYEANKQKMKEPDNPDLIFPGQVLIIPSLNGEYREGTYDPRESY